MVFVATTSDVLQSLRQIGYNGVLGIEKELRNALEGSKEDSEFKKLVAGLLTELYLIRKKVQCNGRAVYMATDACEKVMELEGFIKSLGRIATFQYKVMLIKGLCLKIMCTTIQVSRLLEKKDKEHQLRVAEITKMFITLSLPLPSYNLSTKSTMLQVVKAVTSIVNTSMGSKLLGEALLDEKLNDKKWQKIEDVVKEYEADFYIRRKMILLRLNATIQAFLSKPQPQEVVETLNKIYAEKRKSLKPEPDIDISDILAARDDLPILEKINSTRLRQNTKCAVNKVIIGNVPDRGGNVIHNLKYGITLLFNETSNPNPSNHTFNVKRNVYATCRNKQSTKKEGSPSNRGRGYGNQSGGTKYLSNSQREFYCNIYSYN